MRFIAVLLLAFGAGLSQGCMRSQILRFQRHYDGYRVWDFDMEHIRTIQELHAAYAKAGRRSQNPFRLGRPELNSEFVLTAEVMILKRGNKLNTDLRILKRVTANDVEGNTVAKAEYYASPVRHLTTYSLLPDGTLKKAAQTCRELITLDNYIVAGYPAIYFDMLKELKAPGRLGLFETYSTSRSKLRRSHSNQPGKKRRLKALSPKGDETSNNTPGHFQTAKEDNSDIPTHMSGQKMSAAALERSDSGSVNQRPAQTTAPMANYETTTSKVAGESVTRAPKPVAAQTMVDEESFKRRGLTNVSQNVGQPDDEETLKEGSLKEKLQGGEVRKPSRIASERFDRDSSEKNREEVDINRIVSTVPPTEDRTTTTSPNIMDGELGTKNEVEHGIQNYAQKTEEDMMQETRSMMNWEQLITQNPIPMTTEAVLQDTRSTQKNRAVADGKDIFIIIPQRIMEKQTSTKEEGESVTLNLTQATDQGMPQRHSSEEEAEDVTRKATLASERKSLDENGRTNGPSALHGEPSRKEKEGKGIDREPSTSEQDMLKEMPSNKREAGNITHSSSEPTKVGMTHENNPSTEKRGENADNHLTTTITERTVETELFGSNEVSNASVDAAEYPEVNVTYATPSFRREEGEDVTQNNITLTPERTMERQTPGKKDDESSTRIGRRTSESRMLKETHSMEKSGKGITEMSKNELENVTEKHEPNEMGGKASMKKEVEVPLRHHQTPRNEEQTKASQYHGEEYGQKLLAETNSEKKEGVTGTLPLTTERKLQHESTFTESRREGITPKVPRKTRRKLLHRKITHSLQSERKEEGPKDAKDFTVTVPQEMVNRKLSENAELESTSKNPVQPTAAIRLRRNHYKDNGKEAVTQKPYQTSEANVLHERASWKEQQREYVIQNLATAILPKMAGQYGKDDSESVTRNPAKATHQDVLHEMPSLKKKEEGVIDNLVTTIPRSEIKTSLSESNGVKIATRKPPLMSKQNILEMLTTEDENAGDAIENLTATIAQRATERRDFAEKEQETNSSKYAQTTAEDMLHRTYARNGGEGFTPKPIQEWLNETTSLKESEVEDIVNGTNTTAPETIMEEQVSEIKKLKDITRNPAQETELTTPRKPQTPLPEKEDVIIHTLTTKPGQVLDKVTFIRNEFGTQASETTEHEVLHNSTFLRRKAEMTVKHLMTTTPKRMKEREHSGKGLESQTQNPVQSSEQKISRETPVMETKGEGVIEDVTTMNRHHHLVNEEPSRRGQLDMNSLNLNQTAVYNMKPKGPPEKQEQEDVSVKPIQTLKQNVLGENSAEKIEKGNAIRLILTPTPLQEMYSGRKELEGTTMNTPQPNQERVLNEGSSSEEKRGNITETREHHPQITERSSPKALPAKNEQNSSNEYYAETPEYEVLGEESSENSDGEGGIRMLVKVSPENTLDTMPTEKAEPEVIEQTPLHGKTPVKEERGVVTSTIKVAQMTQRLKENERSDEKEQRSDWQQSENATEEKISNQMDSQISEGGAVIQEITPTAESLSKGKERYARMDQEKVGQKPEQAIESEPFDEKSYGTDERGQNETIGVKRLQQWINEQSSG